MPKKSVPQRDKKALQQRHEVLTALFPGVKYAGDHMSLFLGEKSLDSFVENQYNVLESTRNKRIKPKCVYEDSDSDEELKLQLKNAVKQHKRNKKEDPKELESSSKADRPKRNSDDIDEKAGLNATQFESTSAVESEVTSKKSPANVNNETKKIGSNESNESASSDIQQLISLFFNNEIDRPRKTEVKKYSDYEKQGAIPKTKFRKHSDENAFVGVKNTKHSKSNKAADKDVQFSMVNSDHSYTRKKSSGTIFSNADFSQQNSSEKIVKLSERACSKPFFYIVPENPSPNFLFPRGSYYVIPKEYDSSSGEKTIFHPETLGFTINGSGDFEIEDWHFPRNQKIQNMNDLGKEVIQKTDSHLNIGPGDVKDNESLRNLEKNYEPRKIYDKSLGRSGVPPSGVVTFREEEEEGMEEKEASDTRQEGVSAAQQMLLLEFPELDAVAISNIVSNYHVEDGSLLDFIASKHLEKKIEEQLMRMISAFPENDIEELREICNGFEGDEDKLKRYIANRQRVLEMQYIFPEADPDYLLREVEKLNGCPNAINTLTEAMLDRQDYPKISNNQTDAEARKLWRMYVENFNVEDYVRNVPNPENFKHEEKSQNYDDLALEFLKSRYPEEPLRNLSGIFAASGKNILRTCTSDSLSQSYCVRLAASSFNSKNYTEPFLKEICYVDHKPEIDRYVAELKALKEAEEEEARLNDTFLFCPLCCNDEVVASDAVTCPEGHLFCKDCVKRYVFVKLGDGLYKYPCPSDDCETFFSDVMLGKLLPDSILSNIVKKQQAAEIRTAEVEGLECCPYCEFAYIPNPDDKIFKCQNVACLIETCRKCQEKNHIPLRCEEVERPQDVEARKKIEETMTQKLVRICPTCFKKFVKLDGCNKMICTCGTMVCYYCRRKIEGYDHFQRTTFQTGKCPLYSNNETLHLTDVVQAGIQVRNEILQENPNVRIVHDPISNNG